MARPEVRDAGRALRQKAGSEAKRHHRPLRYAVITRAKPLTAELTDGSLVLDDDDLVLGQWPEQYRKQYGLRVDDTLIVNRMSNGDWLATDVVSDRPIRKFVRTKASAKEAEGGGGEGGEETEPEEGSEETEAETSAADEIDRSEFKGFCEHGSDPNFPRPADFPSVDWFGTVEPLNGKHSDTLIVPP